MPRNYKSEALAAVHEMIEGLQEAGAVDKRTQREFDEACLAPAVGVSLTTAPMAEPSKSISIVGTREA